MVSESRRLQLIGSRAIFVWTLVSLWNSFLLFTARSWGIKFWNHKWSVSLWLLTFVFSWVGSLLLWLGCYFVTFGIGTHAHTVWWQHKICWTTGYTMLNCSSKKLAWSGNITVRCGTMSYQQWNQNKLPLKDHLCCDSCPPFRWPSRHYKRWWSCHHCVQNCSLVCALHPEDCFSLDLLVMAKHCSHVPLPLNAVPRSSVSVLPA
jgi:hypothetical protein